MEFPDVGRCADTEKMGIGLKFNRVQFLVNRVQSIFASWNRGRDQFLRLSHRTVIVPESQVDKRLSGHQFFGVKKILPSLFSAALCSGLGLSLQAKPKDLVATKFADQTLVPSPACLCASPYGEVYVGVDLNGSLGKGAGKGRIVKLIDADNDGVADSHTIFAEMDNPRGLTAVGDQLFVLHTVIPAETDIMTGMHLSVLEDKDRDGVADGPGKVLIKNISTLKHNQDRGADHTTNGIRMGIDGWIYIAVGDFGFVDAVGADGKKMTLLGGGVLRVRPDGTEMEMYTYGLRNIYDIAIDPFMNIYTRGNTNDGGGWNVRFIHHIQSGNYGYPMLFKRFTSEILPALVDVGGGSGTGALFFQEPGWPAKYNNVPLMADWGRSQLFIHRVTPDGASFTQQEETYIKCSQIADVDVDGSGRMFLAAWDGAGYKGNAEKGYVEQVVPEGWQYQAFPDLEESSVAELLALLKSDSATARFYTQQEILRRDDAATFLPLLYQTAAEQAVALEARVAAIFTLAQLGEAQAFPQLLKLQEDASVREWALRALADRLPLAEQAPIEPFVAALQDANPRVQVAAAVGLGRLGRPEAADALLKVAQPPQSDKPVETTTAHWESAAVEKDGTVHIDVDISAFKSLHLIADEAGADGNDHIAWVNPVITQTDGTVVDLTTRKWKSAKQGWGKTLVNKDCTGKPLIDMKGQQHKGIGSHARSVITFNIPDKRIVDRFQATGLLTKGSAGRGKVKFIVSPTPELAGEEGPHATPNPSIILPHVAVHSLVQLRVIDACVAALGSDATRDGALWALQQLHDAKSVDGLIDQFGKTADAETKDKLIKSLARLHHQEAPYDGSWWWRTKPDTRGPYYVPVTWAESGKIEAFFRSYQSGASADDKKQLTSIADFYRLNLPGIGGVADVSGVDPKKGEVGRTSIEDIILSFEKLKGNKKRGQKVLSAMACIGCHNVAPGQPIKGPDLAGLGAMTLEDIAESIIKPAATIAESWVTVTTKDGTALPGTIVSKDDTELVLHNIAGIPTTIPVANIQSIVPGPPLMGPHLADELSLQEFVDVVTYIKSMGE